MDQRLAAHIKNYVAAATVEDKPDPHSIDYHKVCALECIACGETGEIKWCSCSDPPNKRAISQSSQDGHTVFICGTGRNGQAMSNRGGIAKGIVSCSFRPHKTKEFRGISHSLTLHIENLIS